MLGAAGMGRRGHGGDAGYWESRRGSLGGGTGLGCWGEDGYSRHRVCGAQGARGVWPRCGQRCSQDAGPRASAACRMADPFGDLDELPKENGGSGEGSQLITEQGINRTNKYRAALLQGWPALVAG